MFLLPIFQHLVDLLANGPIFFLSKLGYKFMDFWIKSDRSPHLIKLFHGITSRRVYHIIILFY